MMTQPRVYLAGPDVFEPDARQRFAQLAAWAQAQGLQAIVPMDAEGEPARPDELPQQAAQRIFLANLARLDAADGMVANLMDFRGTEPDSGTVFEVGYAVACGIPVLRIKRGRSSSTFWAACHAEALPADTHIEPVEVKPVQMWRPG